MVTPMTTGASPTAVLQPWHLAAALISMAAIVGAAWLTPLHRLAAWLLIIAAMLTITLAIGEAVTGRASGALIDPYNTMSLSQLQLIAWTIVVLSSFLTAVFSNLFAGQPDPLGVVIPSELWVVLGVGGASAVGKQLILGQKSQQGLAPTQAAAASDQRAAIRRGEQLDADLAADAGVVAKKSSPQDARWIDMFTGDELGNKLVLDVGELQLFLFTLSTVLAYCGAIVALFQQHTGTITSLPAPDSSMVTLLGISHAAYLAYKAAPHTAAPTN